MLHTVLPDAAAASIAPDSTAHPAGDPIACSAASVAATAGPAAGTAVRVLKLVHDLAQGRAGTVGRKVRPDIQKRPRHLLWMPRVLLAALHAASACITSASCSAGSAAAALDAAKLAVWWLPLAASNGRDHRHREGERNGDVRRECVAGRNATVRRFRSWL